MEFFITFIGLITAVVTLFNSLIDLRQKYNREDQESSLKLFSGENDHRSKSSG